MEGLVRGFYLHAAFHFAGGGSDWGTSTGAGTCEIVRPVRGSEKTVSDKPGSEEVDGLHVDDIASDDNGSGLGKVRVVVVIQQQTIDERVIDAQVAAFSNVLHVPTGEALKTSDVAVVRRDD